MPYIQIQLSMLSDATSAAETRRLIEPVCSSIREMSRANFNLHPRSLYDKENILRSLREISCYAQQKLDDEYAAYTYTFHPDTHTAAESALELVTSILDSLYNLSVVEHSASHLKNLLHYNCTPERTNHCLYSALDLLLLVTEEAYCQVVYSDFYQISIC